jgi:hypothetical protein
LVNDNCVTHDKALIFSFNFIIIKEILGARSFIAFDDGGSGGFEVPGAATI